MRVKITYGWIALLTIAIGLASVAAGFAGVISHDRAFWASQSAALFAAWLLIPTAVYGEPAFALTWGGTNG